MGPDGDVITVKAPYYPPVLTKTPSADMHLVHIKELF